MKVKRFVAPDMRQAMRQVREELGPDAAILSQHRVKDGFEIVAAVDYDASLLDPAESRRSPAGRYQYQDKDGENSSVLRQELERARSRLNASNQLEPGLEENAFQRQATDFQAAGYFRSRGNGEPTPPPAHDVEQVDLSGASGKDEAIRAMQSEIQSLRDMLRQQMKERAIEQSPLEILLQRRLRSFGLSDALIEQVLDQLSIELSDQEQEPELALAWQSALAHLESSISVVEEELIEQGGVLALMGPTGVGKTTSIGKLAARYVLKHGPDTLALITTDCYRIAAYEQLRTFGRILGVPVRVVDERNSLDATLKTLRNKALVLIDTAGLNSRDPNLAAQLRLLESATSRVKRFLVLPATSQIGVLRDNYRAYKAAGLNGCILTKIDEAARLGDVISLVCESQLPLAYVADGQRVPDDIQPADVHALIKRAAQIVERAEQATDGTAGES